MKADSYAELGKLFSATFDVVRFLNSIGWLIENTGVDPLIILTVSKFYPIMREWEKSLRDSTQASTLAKLERFFSNQLALQQSVEAGRPTQASSQPKLTNPKTHVFTTLEQNNSPKPKPCVNCRELHQLHKCANSRPCQL